jgi:hypothetical protein
MISSTGWSRSVGRTFFRGKFVVDAGCGAGLQSRFLRARPLPGLSRAE